MHIRDIRVEHERSDHGLEAIIAYREELRVVSRSDCRVREWRQVEKTRQIRVEQEYQIGAEQK